MRHLVTGGAGFIGSALCNRLADDGHRVEIFDDCSRGKGAGLRERERFIMSRPERSDIRWDEVDGPSQLRCFIASNDDGEPLDCMWHLAARNGTANFYSNPYEVLEIQLRGTLNAIDACEVYGVKTLVLFSSSEVYQTPPTIPTHESVPLSIPDITNPRYSYAVGKIAAEAMAWHSAIERVLIIRPHNVVGPNMGYDHVIPQFILRAARTPVHGTFDINGSATRSFIYIDDFTDAMMTIWEHTQRQEGRAREIYHVGTEEQTTTVALAGQISDLMGKKGPQYPRGYAYKFKTNPGPEGGTRSRCPDTSKLRALGWSQKTSFEEGLKKTIAAYLEKESAWPT